MSFEKIELKLDKCLQAIHRIEIIQTKQELTLEKNTLDVEMHIKRTNLLEKKVSKIYMFALLAAGFVMAKYGTDIIKIIGIL